MAFIIGTAGFRQHYYKKKTITKSKVLNLINVANRNNIYTFDTSPGYGDIESFIGKNVQSNLMINTKVIIEGASITEMIKNCERQIVSIKKKTMHHTIKTILLHNPWKLDISDRNIFASKFYELLKKFNIFQWGISIYETKELIGWGTNFYPTVVQVPFNIFDQRFKKNQVEKIMEKKVTIQVRSIFLKGLILNKKLINKKWPTEWISHLENWFSWAEKNDLNLLNVCISFLKKNQNSFDDILLGVLDDEELKLMIDCWNKTHKNYDTDVFLCNNSNLIDPRKWDGYE